MWLCVLPDALQTTNQISSRIQMKSHFLFVVLLHHASLRLSPCTSTPVLDLFLCFFLLSIPSRLVFLCLSCSAGAISSDGSEESELVRVKTLQTRGRGGGGGGTGIFNTYRLYSMSAMFPRQCRAFLYAFSASAILPWFFSTFPKFPQAKRDMSVKSQTVSGKTHGWYSLRILSFSPDKHLQPTI